MWKFIKDILTDDDKKPLIDQSHPYWKFQNEMKFAWTDIKASHHVSINRDDKTLFSVETTWQEYVTKTRYAGSQRSGGSFRIARGVSVNNSRSNAIYEKIDGYNEVSSGILVLTAQCLMFVGAKKSFRVKTADILKFQATTDPALIVQIANKPSYAFKMTADDGLWFATLLPMAQARHPDASFTISQAIHWARMGDPTAYSFFADQGMLEQLDIPVRPELTNALSAPLKPVRADRAEVAFGRRQSPLWHVPEGDLLGDQA